MRNDQQAIRFILAALDHSGTQGASPDMHSVANVLIACAQTMLPYWESHYTDDEKMSRVVRALTNWGHDRSDEQAKLVAMAHAAVSGRCRYSGYDHGLCDPGKLDFVGSDCPADFAGDSIVWAAASVVNINGTAESHMLAQRSIECAVEAISRVLSEREPLDNAQDTWREAQEHLVRRIAQLAEDKLG